MFAVAGLALYEVARLVSQRSTALIHARQVLEFERDLGIDWEHALQTFTINSPDLRTWGNGVYTWMYWPVVLGALIVAWHADRRYYAILRDGMLLSGAAGLLVFIFYPVAPPRMLPGFADTILGGSIDHAVVHGTIADSYAALPSFHVGWVALAATVMTLLAPRPVTLVLAVVATGAMTAAVVVTGNHFIIDAISGFIVAFAGGFAAARLHRSADQTVPAGKGDAGYADPA